MIESDFVEGYFRLVEQGQNIQRTALLEEQNTRVLKFIGNYLDFPLRFVNIDQSNISSQPSANRNLIIDQLTFLSTNPSLTQYLPFFVQFNNIRYPSGDMSINTIENYLLDVSNSPARFKVLNSEYEDLTETSVLVPTLTGGSEYVISDVTIFDYTGNQVNEKSGTYIFFRDDDRYYRKNVATGLISQAGIDPRLWLWNPADNIVTIDGFPLGDRSGLGIFGVYLNRTLNQFYVTPLNFNLTLPLPTYNQFNELVFNIDPINQNIKGNILNGNLVLIYDDNTNGTSILEINSNGSVLNRFTDVNPALVTTNDVFLSLTGELHYLWDFSNLELYHLITGGTIITLSIPSGRSTRACSFAIQIPVSNYQNPLNQFNFFTMDEFGDLYLGSADFNLLTLSLTLVKSYGQDLLDFQRYRNQLIHLLRGNQMVIVNLNSGELVEINLPLNLSTLPRSYEGFFFSDKYWLSVLNTDAQKQFINYSVNSRSETINQVYQYTFHFDELTFPIDTFTQLLFDLDTTELQINKKYEIFKVTLDYRIRYSKQKQMLDPPVPQKDQQFPIESLEDMLACQDDCNETEANCETSCVQDKCKDGVCPIEPVKEKCRKSCKDSNCFKKCGRAETQVSRVMGYVPPDFAVSDLLKLYTS